MNNLPKNVTYEKKNRGVNSEVDENPRLYRVMFSFLT